MARAGNGAPSGTANGGAKASSSRLSSLKSSSPKGRVDFGDCSPQMLQEVITNAVEEGALISFSKTSDGGALVLYVKDGPDEYKEYAPTPELLESHLGDLHRTYKL